MVQRELPGVRWYASAYSYTDTQLDIAGFDEGRDVCSPEMARHVVGYDPDVFTTMGFCALGTRGATTAATARTCR